MKGSGSPADPLVVDCEPRESADEDSPVEMTDADLVRGLVEVRKYMERANDLLVPRFCQQIVNEAADRLSRRGAENQRLREQDEVHWKTRRSLVAKNERREKEAEEDEQKWTTILYSLIDAIDGRRGMSLPEDVERAKAEVKRLRNK